MMNGKSVLILAAAACLSALSACDHPGGGDPLDFEFSTSGGKVSITKYTGSGGSVTIPSTIDGLPVTSIGNDAFKSCHGLTSVVIPSTVTSIGDSAYFGCDELASTELPSSLISIGDAAFAYAHLSSIVIPSSVTSIGENSFAYCTNLASVHVKRYVPGGSPEITAVHDYSFHSNAAGRIIYVPTAAVASYKADTNWLTYETNAIGTIQGE
jgi:hypothetical protein